MKVKSHKRKGKGKMAVVKTHTRKNTGKKGIFVSKEDALNKLHKMFSKRKNY